MKIKQVNYLVGLILSLTISLPFLSNNFDVALADDNEIENIGYLYSIETVSSLTKVIINDNNVFTWLNDIGRSYTYEWISVPIGGDDPLPPPGQIGNGIGNEINGGYMQVKQYYYFASPTSPKIIGRTMMKNDVSSVVRAVQYLEYLANSQGITDKNNAILGYIRCINNSYTSDTWSIVAGTLNTSFCNYVNSLSDIGMTIREFFASFIDSDYFNSNYGTCSSTYLNKYVFLYDPITEMADIDLIHFFASLDAIFLNTGETYYNFPYYVIEARTFRYLASWAGDLQTVTVDLTSYNGNLYSFVDILQNSNLSFDKNDFYADVDAINIAYNVSLSNSFSLSTAFSNYYNNLTTQDFRISTFCTNIIHMNDSNDSLSFSNLQPIIYEMLCMHPDGTHNGGEAYLTCLAKYKLLGYDAVSLYAGMPNLAVRQSVADLFISYLWSFIDE